MGKRFSNEPDAGVTVQFAGFRPTSCALRGLIALPWAIKSLHASTILRLQFPEASDKQPIPFPAAEPGIVTSTGTWTEVVLGTSTRKPSNAANQKSLSLMICPPAVPPNCSTFAGVTVPVNGFAASVAEASRPNAYAV